MRFCSWGSQKNGDNGQLNTQSQPCQVKDLLTHPGWPSNIQTFGIQGGSCMDLILPLFPGSEHLGSSSGDT